MHSLQYYTIFPRVARFIIGPRNHGSIIKRVIAHAQFIHIENSCV